MGCLSVRKLGGVNWTIAPNVLILLIFRRRQSRVVEKPIHVRACVCECVCVCLFVSCLSVRDHYLRNEDLHQIFVGVTYGRGSVLLWRRSFMLCTSRFMDDVIFTHKPKLLDVAAQLKRSAHASLGLAMLLLCAVIPVVGQRTHGTTFRALKVTFQVATPGPESAVYDCLVELWAESQAVAGCQH